MAILYISHKLDEIKALCHHATILRLGKRVSTVNIDNESTSSLAMMMMGEELEKIKQRQTVATGEIRLKVDNLTMPAIDSTGISLTDIHLEVRAGEIVGIAGVAGNGQDELLKALNGEESCRKRRMHYYRKSTCRQTWPQCPPQGRHGKCSGKSLGHGAIPDMDLVDNAFMTGFLRMGLLAKGLINYSKTRTFAHKVISDFGVKTHGSSVPANSLSGGNLQKFIIGRELTQQPEILIVSQPTWGVDAGAAQTIRHSLRKLADKGAAVLVISQDLDELMEMSDRIGAICGGRLSSFYPTGEMTVEKVGLLMAGVSLEEGGANVASLS